jgi:ribosomal protein L2
MDGYDHHFGYITKLAPQKTKKTLRQQMHQTTQNHFHSKSTQNHLNGINPHNLQYRNVCHNDTFLCELFTCSVAEIIYDFTRSTHFLSVFFFSE